MNRFKWQIVLGVLLVASVVLYVVQIEIFHTPRDTFFYLFRTWLLSPFRCSS